MATGKKKTEYIGGEGGGCMIPDEIGIQLSLDSIWNHIIPFSMTDLLAHGYCSNLTKLLFSKKKKTLILLAYQEHTVSSQR